MRIFLTEEQRMIREDAERFSRKELSPHAFTHDELEIISEDILKNLFHLGFMGMQVPAEYGGTGDGALSYALALSEISRGCASTAVTMGVTNMAAEILFRFGNPEQRKRFLPPLLSGKVGPASFALTEPDAGSDAGGITTRAEKKGDRYVINGVKAFITAGNVAGLVIVMAVTNRDPKELSAFIVEPPCVGFSVGKIERKMGLKGSSTVELIFEDCELPSENLLGREGEGFKIAMTALDGGRIAIGAQSVGIARESLQAAIRYGKERKKFGRPVNDFGSISNMIADSQTEIDAAWLLTLQAASLKDKGKHFSKEASMAKLYASEMACRVCQRAVQIHGGYGYLLDYPVERHLRDVKVTTIYEGTSEIQRMIISRSLMR